MDMIVFYIVLFIIMFLLIQALPVLIPLFVILYLVSLVLGYRRRSQITSFSSDRTTNEKRTPKKDAIDVDYTEREDGEQ